MGKTYGEFCSFSFVTSERVLRNFGWRERGMTIDFRWNRNTFRLCIGPDLMKEKGYKFKLQKK